MINKGKINPKGAGKSTMDTDMEVVDGVLPAEVRRHSSRRVVLLVDIRNAFNSVNLSKILLVDIEGLFEKPTLALWEDRGLGEDGDCIEGSTGMHLRARSLKRFL